LDYGCYLMQYKNVCLESIGYVVPAEIWSTEEVEQKLAPLYERLKLPAGRLELMTGIKERRFWPRDVRPSQVSVESCRHAIEAAEIDPALIGCLIHGSVCRDFLEPATACTVHDQVGLESECFIYDVSNACLGILSGMIQAANMIELGQIKAALIVGTEGGRQLVENTIRTLNADETLTRKSIKNAVASLTIGSASCAVLLTDRSISKTENLLTSASVIANTQFCDLCKSHNDQAGAEMEPLMQTDSELLMQRGVETGVQTMTGFLSQAGWSVDDIDRTVCHQVGGAHRKMMLASLSLDPEIDFPTFSWLGNTGSAALPSALAVACEEEFVTANQNVALLGIGSGINCTMMSLKWSKSLIASSTWQA
jgi:3-oxoacyl-[acyl-carrier-protein] synthase-3